MAHLSNQSWEKTAQPLHGLLAGVEQPKAVTLKE
jgi:hypothetical protein